MRDALAEAKSIALAALSAQLERVDPPPTCFECGAPATWADVNVEINGYQNGRPVPTTTVRRFACDVHHA